MAKLIYSAITLLDGYVEDAEGKFDWRGVFGVEGAWEARISTISCPNSPPFLLGILIV